MAEERHLAVLYEKNAKHVLSDVLSNIKLAVRHEIQQRRQLHDQMVEIRRIVDRHESALHDAPLRQIQPAFSALSQHQDMQTLLNDMASIKEQLSTFKMDLAKNRCRADASPDSFKLRTSDEISPLGDSLPTKLQNNLHATATLTRAALSYRSVKDSMFAVQQELGELRSRVSQAEEKLSSDADSCKAMKASVLEAVKQLIESGAPKIERVLDSLRLAERNEHSQISQLGRSHQNLLNDVSNRYRITEDFLDQFHKEFSNRIMRLETVVRAEIRSRKGSDQDLQSQLAQLSEITVQRLHDSQASSWNEIFAVAESVANLKRLHDIDMDRITKAHDHLSKSTSGSLLSLSARVLSEQQSQAKSMVASRAQTDSLLDQQARRCNQWMERHRSEQKEWTADVVNQIHLSNERLLSGIESNMAQATSALDALSIQIEGETRARLNSIQLLRSDTRRHFDEFREDVNVRIERASNATTALQSEVQSDRAQFKSLLENIEASSSKDLASLKTYVDAEVPSVNERVQRCIDGLSRVENSVVDSISKAMNEQSSDLENAAAKLLARISELDEKHAHESDRIRTVLRDDIRELTRRQHETIANVTRLEESVETRAKEVQAQVNWQSETLQSKLSDLEETCSDHWRSQDAVNEYVKTVVDATKEADQQKSTELGRDLELLRRDHDQFVDVTTSDHAHLRDVFKQESAARNFSHSQLSAALERLEQAMRSGTEHNRQWCDDHGDLVRQSTNELRERIREGRSELEQALADLQQRISIRIDSVSNTLEVLGKSHSDEKTRIKHALDELTSTMTVQQQSERDLKQSIVEIRTQTDALEQRTRSWANSWANRFAERSSEIDDLLKPVKLKLDEHDAKFASVANDFRESLEAKSKQSTDAFQQEISSARCDISELKEQIVESQISSQSLLKQVGDRIKKLDSEGREAQSQLQDRIEQVEDMRHRQISELQEAVQEQVAGGEQLRRELDQASALNTQTEADLRKALLDVIAESAQRTDAIIEETADMVEKSNDAMRQKIDQIKVFASADCEERCRDVAATTESALQQLSQDVNGVIVQATNRVAADAASSLQPLTNKIDDLGSMCSALLANVNESGMQLRSRLSAMELELNKTMDNFGSQQRKIEQAASAVEGNQHEVLRQYRDLLDRCSDLGDNNRNSVTEIKRMGDELDKCRSTSSSVHDGLEMMSEQVRATRDEIAKLTARSADLDQIMGEMRRSQSSLSAKTDNCIDVIAADLKSRCSQLESALQEIRSATDSLWKLHDSDSAELSKMQMAVSDASASSSSASLKLTEFQHALDACVNSIEIIREHSDAQFQESQRTCNGVLEKVREQCQEQDRKADEGRRRNETMVDLRISSSHEQVEMEILSMASAVSSLDKQVKAMLSNAITNDALESAIQASKSAIEVAIDSKLRMQSAARKTLEDAVRVAETSLRELQSELGHLRDRLEPTQ